MDINQMPKTASTQIEKCFSPRNMMHSIRTMLRRDTTKTRPERKRQRRLLHNSLLFVFFILLIFTTLTPGKNCLYTTNQTQRQDAYNNVLSFFSPERFTFSTLWNLNPPTNDSKTKKTITSDRTIEYKCGRRLNSISRNNRVRASNSYHFRNLLDNQLRPSGRIVGGRIATIENFPWIVSLQREKNFWLGFRAFYHSCGGSIITPSWIVTAAHCIYERDEPLRAVAGTDNMNFLYRAQIRSIDRQIYHPNFDISSYDNDIALIKVSKPFDLDSTFSQVGLVCLDPNTPILPYDIATICGFGARAFHKKARSHLYETEIAIIEPKTCNSSFGYTITRNMICAGGMIENKRDACSGDSGGPLMLQDLDDGHNVQIGIVSFGNDCAMENFPGIYTRLSNYYDWILDNIDEPLPEP